MIIKAKCKVVEPSPSGYSYTSTAPIVWVTLEKKTESVRARGLEVCYKIVSLNKVRRNTHNVLPARLPKLKLNKDNKNMLAGTGESSGSLSHTQRIQTRNIES